MYAEEVYKSKYVHTSANKLCVISYDKYEKENLHKVVKTQCKHLIETQCK